MAIVPEDDGDLRLISFLGNWFHESAAPPNLRLLALLPPGNYVFIHFSIIYTVPDMALNHLSG